MAPSSETASSPLREFDHALTAPEREIMAQLTTPHAIQKFVDDFAYSDEEIYRCPLRSLRDRKAHCFDGALFAATALRRIGYPPLILELLPAEGRDDDHLLALFKIDGHWGAISKSNFVGLRFREPVFLTLRELVMSYFEFFYNVDREKTLRGYGAPVRLERIDSFKWMTSDENLEEVVRQMDSARHFTLLTPAMIDGLSPVDERSYQSGLSGANEAGLFRPAPKSPTPNSAVVPTPKLEEDFYDWHARHDAKCRAAAHHHHELIFIGDSITHLFEGDPNVPGRGKRVWHEQYARRKPLNLGFGWDRTQNVLWRLTHGELAGQTPRLVVLLIGTNNLTGTPNAPTNTPAEIAEGVKAICTHIHATSPSTRVLLMGVFPRGTPHDPLRKRIHELNKILQHYAECHPAIQFVDIGDRFVSSDGTIPVDLMNDGVHPTENGYRVWAQAIEPMVAEALGE